MVEPLHICLRGERPKSWNVLKRLDKWRWQDEVDRVKLIMRAALPAMPPVYTCRVDISVVVYFRANPYDSDNIPAKLMIDGLLNLVIPDDSPRYLRRVCTESCIDRKRPRVEITLTPVEETP